MSVVTMRSRLSEADIRALIKAPRQEERASAAHKLCRCIDEVELSEADRAHAETILRMLAADAVALVREAVAVSLKNSPRLPRDVARRLARDIETVALPILEFSPALSDADLVEIVRTCDAARQTAVASRSALSSFVTNAIARHGAPEAVERALANDNARFDESGLELVLTRMGDRPRVSELMARREQLPVRIAEKLISLVSGEVFDHLVNHHELPPQLAIDLATGARERATLDLVEQAGRQSDVAGFARQLHQHGRLTPSFIMRAVCLGHIAFVEHAMAELAGLPHQRAWLLMHDAGPLGLRSLFERTNLPVRLFAPFRAAVELHHQLRNEGQSEDRGLFRRRMVERVLTLFQSIPKDDLEYLLDKLDAAPKRGRASA